LLILGILLFSEKKGRPFPGRTFWGYLLLYGVSRFIIEFYRGETRGTVDIASWALSTSQFVSLFIVPLSLIMLVLLGRKYGPAPVDTATRRAKVA
jgi:phosphatidylglycerol:prolipoprotein diacylglycerol transferase